MQVRGICVHNGPGIVAFQMQNDGMLHIYTESEMDSFKPSNGPNTVVLIPNGQTRAIVADDLNMDGIMEDLGLDDRQPTYLVDYLQAS